ncbi:hypothetical protein [Paraburkholderia bryophila]|uniref:Uncharacterized protein n=1 Tax=Paraburkholderia bryophila TaxID=420952 RepID=A0A329CNQ0_9BURK|nr:hypothetical protein [Paraburkholderia bryophila]RAS35868.1 hypothetical protein BX591_104198 [Paraburkholderia bryophila]
METKVDTNATQEADAPQSVAGGFNRRVGERLHCEHPVATQDAPQPTHPTEEDNDVSN